LYFPPSISGYVTVTFTFLFVGAFGSVVIVGLSIFSVVISTMFDICSPFPALSDAFVHISYVVSFTSPLNLCVKFASFSHVQSFVPFNLFP